MERTCTFLNSDLGQLLGGVLALVLVIGSMC